MIVIGSMTTKMNTAMLWICYKDFLVKLQKNDTDAVADNIVAQYTADFQSMYPFVQFLRKAITDYSG